MGPQASPGAAGTAWSQDTPGAPTVTFSPCDIFSRWGFEGGNLLSTLMVVWAGSRGLSYYERGDWRYADHKALLYVTYRELVERPGWEPVVFVDTNHNPVRARSGGIPERPEPNETSPAVEVSVERIFAVADELFPPRSRSWLRLHHAAHDLWAYSSPDRPHFPHPADWRREQLFAPTVEHIVAEHSLSEEEMQVVASLLESWRSDRKDSLEAAPIGVLHSAVETARAALT